MLQTPVYELYTEEAVTSQVRYTVIDNVKYYAVRDIATKLLRYSQSNRVANNFPGIIKVKAYLNNQKVVFNFIKSEDVIKFVTKYRTRATPEVMAWAMAVSKMKNEEPKELVKADNFILDGKKVELKKFNFSGFDLDVFTHKEKPMFFGSQVAKLLGYKDPKNAVWKVVPQRHTEGVAVSNGVDVIGKVTAIDEPGLYKLILKSTLPQAEEFSDWVTDEVLPSIRKHGAYMTPDTVEQAILNPDTMIQIATRLKEEQEERRRLEEQNQMLSVEVKKSEPLVSYANKVLLSDELLTTSLVARSFGIKGFSSAKSFNLLLKSMGIQYKTGHTWYLYAKYAQKDYVEYPTSTDRFGETRSDIMKWTQKGRLFLYEQLTKAGYKIRED